MLDVSVSIMVSLSMPMPQPAVGGRPYSRLVQKPSSMNMASSSPCALACTSHKFDCVDVDMSQAPIPLASILYYPLSFLQSRHSPLVMLLVFLAHVAGGQRQCGEHTADSTTACCMAWSQPCVQKHVLTVLSCIDFWQGLKSLQAPLMYWCSTTIAQICIASYRQL